MSVEQETRPAAASPGRTMTRLIDVDVHPTVDGGLAELFPYMTEGWREKLKGQAGGGLRPGIAHRLSIPTGGTFRDATPPDGGAPASDADFLRKDLLDRYAIENALLIVVEAATMAVATTDPDYSAVLVSACNDYFIERWVDDRMRLALAVSPLDPELAVKEIRRHGQNPKVAAIFLPIPNIRLGNRHYYPIYEAALELGLPIATHPGAGEASFQGAAVFAGGLQERYIERYCDWGQIAWSQITSLMFSGAFQRYPDLKVLFIEWGFTWAVPLMWRMDKAWHAARIEVPWVTKWPSEYVRDHIRFSTQPIDEPHQEKDLDRLVEDYFADTLMFATDYPHWDTDLPGTVLKTLSPETRDKVYYRNAKAVLRL